MHASAPKGMTMGFQLKQATRTREMLNPWVYYGPVRYM